MWGCYAGGDLGMLCRRLYSESVEEALQIIVKGGCESSVRCCNIPSHPLIEHVQNILHASSASATKQRCYSWCFYCMFMYGDDVPSFDVTL